MLPLSEKKLALYGSGSGDVQERHSIAIEEGLKSAGFEFPTALGMDRFQKNMMRT